MPLCFAYGSNMDRAAMAERCPRSVPLAPARLAGYRFAILPEGYATVRPDPRRTVWGILWRLALADLGVLDRYEGVSEGLYRKAFLPVLTPSGPRRALVYLGCAPGEGRPRPGYMEAVVDAGAAAGLPNTYLRELAAHLGGRDGAATVRPEPGGAHVRPLRATPHDPPPPGRARLAPWSP